MDKLNTQQVVENIYTLAKQRNITIKTLETNANVSVGYLAKMSNPNSRLPLDVVHSIAGQFGMTMDALVNYDPAGLTTQEKKICKLFEKLTADTNADKLEWKVFLKDVYARKFTKDEIEPLNKKGLPPLADITNAGTMVNADGTKEDLCAVTHNSMFRNFNVATDITANALNSFAANIGKDVMVFVALVAYTYQEPKMPAISHTFNGYEMYFIKDGRSTKVCQATAWEYPAYLHYFEKLQAAIKNYDARGRLDKNATAIIDNYLGADA